jgi:rubrerythrin
MPDFGNAFSGLKADRTLSPQELIRAIRFMVAAEYEAVQLYTQLAESTDNELAKRVLLDIADEEIVHAGEFLTLLKKLAPEEEGFYQQGAQEVLEMEAEMSAGTAAGDTESAPAPEASVSQEPSGASKPAATVGSLLDKG